MAYKGCLLAGLEKNVVVLIVLVVDADSIVDIMEMQYSRRKH